MASIPMDHSSDTRRALLEHGGENVMHCYQCATCSSVCELAPANNPFPRRQILLAQWGLFDELMGDPGPWLCHQCNDCSVRCPRDVRPGDVMASVRAMTVEKLAVPSFLGSLVGNVRKTWPLLVFGPILFWVVLLGLVTQFGPVESHHGLTAGGQMGQFFYEDYVPHWMIYAVNFAAVGFVGLVLFSQGSKFW